MPDNPQPWEDFVRVKFPAKNPLTSTFRRTLLVTLHEGTDICTGSGPSAAADRSNPLPFIVEIDLRFPEWVEQARVLASERAAVATRVHTLRSILAQPDVALDSSDFERQLQLLIETETRLARLVAQARTMQERLAVAGYELLDYGRELRDEYRATDLHIRRTRLHSRQVTHHGRSGDRTVVRDARHSSGGAGASSQAKYDPLTSYLAEPLSDLCIQGANATILADFAEALGRAQKDIRNGDKDVRYLKLHDLVFIDQYGTSLDILLDEAEKDPVRRMQLLLVFDIQDADPVSGAMGRRLIVVHNPVRGLHAPGRFARVSAAITVEVTVEQHRSHYLGPLAETVCLAPGERRVLRISTENRSSRARRTESKRLSRSSTETRRSVRDQVSNSLDTSDEQTRNSKWDVNANGSAGPVTFGGAAGGGTNETTKTTARNLTDRVSEAIDTASSMNELAFSFSEDSTESSATIREETVELSNVNVGRTATYKFFHILFGYDVKTRVVGVPRIVIDQDSPLIPGLDTYARTVLPVQQAEDGSVSLDHESFKKHGLCAEPFGKKLLDLIKTELDAFNENNLTESTRFAHSGLFQMECETGNSPTTEPYISAARDADVALTRARASAIAEGRVVIYDHILGGKKDPS